MKLFLFGFNSPIVQTGNVPSYDGYVPVPLDSKPPMGDPGTPGRMYAKAAMK